MNNLHFKIHCYQNCGLCNIILSTQLGLMIGYLTNRKVLFYYTKNIDDHDYGNKNRISKNIDDLYEIDAPYEMIKEEITIDCQKVSSSVYSYKCIPDSDFLFNRKFCDLSIYDGVSDIKMTDNIFGFYSVCCYFDNKQKYDAYEFIKNKFKPKQKYIDIANNILEANNMIDFNCIHVRRGDFCYNKKNIHSNILSNDILPIIEKNFSKDTTLLITTDEKNRSWFDSITSVFPKYKFASDLLISSDLLPVEKALVEIIISSKSAHFIGTFSSTYTNIIQQYRCYNNLKEEFKFLYSTDKNVYKLDEYGKFKEEHIGAYSWNKTYKKYIGLSSWIREWPECNINEKYNKYEKYNRLYNFKYVKHFNIKPIRNKKIISFSLYNIDSDLSIRRNFYKGIYVNYHIAKQIYPGWIVRVYMPYNEPIEKIINLSKVSDIELILVDTNIPLKTLRFLPNDDKDVDIWVSRDLDSMLNNKEKVAVDDWLTNYPDKMLHIMHDNTQHSWKILAGMFGVKNDHKHSILNFIFENSFEDKFGIDCDIAEKFFYKDDNYIQ